jgi:hypothetical protein
MIEAIQQDRCPDWVPSCVKTPFFEGLERVKRASFGKDYLSIRDDVPMSRLQQVIHLVSGISLMLPLIGTIVWLFMTTFGSPNRFTDPPSLDPILPPLPGPPMFERAEGSPVVEEAPGLRPRLLSYEGGSWRCYVSITKLPAQGRDPEREEAFVRSPHGDSTSVYGQDGKILSFKMRGPREDAYELEACFEDATHLRVFKKSRTGAVQEKRFEVSPNERWVQEPIIGLRNLARADGREFQCYCFDPRDLNFYKGVAVKEGADVREKNWEKIVVRPNSWVKSLVEGYVWYDPSTNIIQKMSHSYIPLVAQRTAIYSYG